jgi:glycosyltransferase involved in cell wall biosynthesis
MIEALAYFRSLRILRKVHVHSVKVIGRRPCCLSDHQATGTSSGVPFFQGAPVTSTELTVAIPYYRNRQYLGAAVGSVLGQRDPRWRLVISDGSGGADGAVAELVARTDDLRVRVLPSDRPLGMAENWNRCLDAAPSDLITLLHDDDLLLPDYVGRVLAAAAAHPGAVALFCEARIIGPDGEPRFSFPDYVKRFFRPKPGQVVVLRGGPGLRALVRGNFITCPTLCYRRPRLGEHRFDPRWSQVLDLDLTSRVLLEGHHLVGLPDTLYAYRRHPGNATAAQTESLVRFREERALYGEIAVRAAVQRWGRAAAAARGKTIIKLHLICRLAADLLRGSWSAARRKAVLLGALLGESFGRRDASEKSL